jgi:hypothetical protein
LFAFGALMRSACGVADLNVLGSGADGPAVMPEPVQAVVSSSVSATENRRTTVMGSAWRWAAHFAPGMVAVTANP